MGDISETAFNGRLMQVTSYNPSVGDFSYYQGNISVSIASLQTGQFQIDTIYLNYGDFSNFQVNEWTIGSNLALNYSVYNLDTATFDYITIGSTYQIQLPSALNFSYALLKLKTVTRPVTLIFKIRYNALFELIPYQTKFNQLYLSIFSTLFANSDQKLLLCLIGTICGLIVMLFIAVGVVVSVVNSISNTIMLFGHIARFEIDR